MVSEGPGPHGVMVVGPDSAKSRGMCLCAQSLPTFRDSSERDPRHDGRPKQMARGVLESLSYAHQRDQLGLDIRRLDEALEGFMPAVAAAPEQFPAVPGTPYRCALIRKLGDPPGAEPLRIYFETVSTTHVELLSIERINEDPDDPLK